MECRTYSIFPRTQGINPPPKYSVLQGIYTLRRVATLGNTEYFRAHRIAPLEYTEHYRIRRVLTAENYGRLIDRSTD